MNLRPGDLGRLRTFDGPTLSDAIENLTGRDRTTGFAGSDIRCLDPEISPMIGFAVTATVDCTKPGPWPGRGKQSDLWRLLETAPKPAVVVLQHPGPNPERASVFGDVVATIAQRFGAVGLVTDGSVRDFPAIRQLRFGVWARGTVTSRGNNTTLSVGGEVTLSGMNVTTGDLVFADTNGVVLIPKATALDDLFREVAKVREADAERIQLITTPDFTIERL